MRVGFKKFLLTLVIVFGAIAFPAKASENFTAQWEPKTITISYNIGGSTSSTYDAESTLLDSAPVQSGFTFVGWADTEGSSIKWLPGATSTINFGYDRDTILYAVYEYDDLIQFNSDAAFSLAATKGWNGTLQYSLDNRVTWTEWTGSGISVPAGTTLWMKGTGNSKITGSAQENKWVITGTNVTCSGNIETLLDAATVVAGNHPTMANYCYYYMFEGCTALTEAPKLPATTLSNNCYSNMFSGCSALITAPTLPATTLTNYCYFNLFQNCTALTEAPTLPATSLGEFCYRGLFAGCTSLIEAPELPATTLKANCYSNMFAGCTALTKTPELVATTLASFCYYQMFKGCTALTQAPNLPATTLAEYCYQGIVQDCPLIKFSTEKTGECQLEYRIPTSGTGTTESHWNLDMFSGTGGTFTGNPSINTTYYTTPDFKDVANNYLTFDSNTSFTLKVNDATKHWAGVLAYSLDNGATWTIWDGTKISVDSEKQLLMCGIGNTVITGNSSNYRWVLSGSNISCSGNIETLLDYTKVGSGQHPTMAEYCYGYMFYNCISLKQAPALPATTLASKCYYDMFACCIALTQAPTLPAMTLASCCYGFMFRDCTSLMQAPVLPATTLATYCYECMFDGCTSLVQAPALPATTLAERCYESMLKGCTSLTQAPALPATTLAERCYNTMLKGCTSLIQAPALPATTLTNGCYFDMFSGCTSLTQAPALPATILKFECYAHMFEGCTSLTQAPALPAMTLATYCYYCIFKDCTSLKQAPALLATTLAVECYYYMFQGCTSLKFSTSKTGEYQYSYRIPTTGSGTEASNWNYGMFSGTSGTFTGNPSINTTYYTTAPLVYNYISFSSPSSFTLKTDNTAKNWDGTLQYSTNNGSSWSTWNGASTISVPAYTQLLMRGTENSKITGNNSSATWSLTGSNISCSGNIETLLDYSKVNAGQHPTMADYCYAHMFYSCTSLIQAPALPATTLAEYCYRSMFCYCTALTQAPALPAITLASHCYYQMFAECTALTQASALPATTLASYCYYRMFAGCTSLKQAPTLPATALTEGCYFWMFERCTSLKFSESKIGEYQYPYRIPTTGSGIEASYWNRGMFEDTDGTFKDDPPINTTYYTTNPPV